MLNLYAPIVTKIVEEEKSSDGERLSILYHDLFDYPLTFAELIKWRAGKLDTNHRSTAISQKNGYFFPEGRENLIYQRILRRRISVKKLEIARRASKILSFISTVKMIAVTGSLAMGNSTSESDIDLMIVTKKGTLWTTRIMTYMAIWLYGYKTRKPNDKEQKDRLCLNIWMDESDLAFRNRNLYTSHEIAQIVPLVNKDKTYEKFLCKNSWVLDFWPSSVKIENWKLLIKNSSPGMAFFEWIAYKLQRLYMRAKITREVVTPSRALFHPQDWGKVVLDRLQSFS